MARGIEHKFKSDQGGIPGPKAARRKAMLLTSAGLLAGAALAAPSASLAQAATSGAGSTVDEVVVTASRRAESATKLPFNISAYGAEQIERANITSVAGLSSQVPGFVVLNTGARGTESAIPIIRGINASGSTGVAPRFFQSPVGYYLDNAPIVGSYPLMDLERVEVLRGPQGTLYGAGALSGAVRFVAQKPKLSEDSGFLTVTANDVAYSDDYGYDVQAGVNIPIGDKAAIRLVGMRGFTPGFIDTYDILRRTGDDYEGGAPLLANPSDVAGSPGVYFNEKDSNWTKTTAVRAEALWDVTDKLKLEGSFSYAKYDGQGGPVDNHSYQGGVSPVDPRRTLGATGKYERSSPTLEPYDRDSKLAVLDASYDLGFATLSATATYGDTSGKNVADASVALLGSPAAPYYTGTPATPRPAINVSNLDEEETKTQEIRLVSTPGGRLDYVVGAYFEQQARLRGLDVWNPGIDAFTAASHGGSTVPIAIGGTYLPLHADGSVENQRTHQNFTEKSVFGDLTWHVTEDWQITGGARFFDQKFNQTRSIHNAPFFIDVVESNRQAAKSQSFKLNTSYQISSSSQVYATFSQGFRRGGGNAFATEGALQEPRVLLNYVPDKTNNFEVGAKGYFNRIRYSVDAFYVLWDKPQIDMTTPYTLAYVVINGKEATSQGVEFELAGPVGPEGLNFNLGFSYAKARLSESFSLPAGDGGGGIVQGAIIGNKGDRLPGAPDYTASGTVNYERGIGDRQSLLFSLGADYRSSTVSTLPVPSRPQPFYTAPAYVLFRGSVGYSSGDWDVTLYANNLTNQHVVLVGGTRSRTSLRLLGGWGDAYTVSTPREVGLRVTRHW